MQDFYSAGFVPGAIVYFSYDLPEGLEGNIHDAYLKFICLDLLSTILALVFRIRYCTVVFNMISSYQLGCLSSHSCPVYF